MDVKPNNFVFFRDKLKIIDFETAVVCGKHNKEEELKSRNKLKLFIYLFIILTSFSVSRARVDRQVWIYCRRRMTSFSPIIFHLLPLLSSPLLFPPILSPLPLFRTHPASRLLPLFIKLFSGHFCKGCLWAWDVTARHDYEANINCSLVQQDLKSCKRYLFVSCLFLLFIPFLFSFPFFGYHSLYLFTFYLS